MKYEHWKDFRQFDTEKDKFNEENKALKISGLLHEIPIAFAPTYPIGEHLLFNSKRTPGWCDRILFTNSCSANEFWHSPKYDVLQTQTLGDHSPVYLTFTI